MKTCNDCVHIERCRWLIGATGSEVECNWSPSRFVPACQDCGHPEHLAEDCQVVMAGSGAQAARCGCENHEGYQEVIA